MSDKYLFFDIIELNNTQIITFMTDSNTDKIKTTIKLSAKNPIYPLSSFNPVKKNICKI